MRVELIGHCLRIVGIVQQQIADEVSSAVRTFLNIPDRHKQIIPELRIRREILIHAGHGDLARNFHIFGIRLQQFANRPLSREQVLRQRPGNNHGIGALQRMRIALDHLDAEDIDETFRHEDQIPLVADGVLSVLRHGVIDFAQERHERTSCLYVGRRADYIVGKASRQDIPEQRFIAFLVGPENPVGRRVALVERQFIIGLQKYQGEGKQRRNQSREVQDHRHRISADEAFEIS